MGFVIGRTFELDFTGTEVAGAIVKVRSASVATLQMVLEGATKIEDDAKIFAEHLISWNLELKEGEPLPLTAESVLQLEEPFMRLIVGEWIKATRGVTAPLDHRSSGGAKPQEEQIPMETS